MKSIELLMACKIVFLMRFRWIFWWILGGKMEPSCLKNRDRLQETVFRKRKELSK